MKHVLSGPLLIQVYADLRIIGIENRFEKLSKSIVNNGVFASGPSKNIVNNGVSEKRLCKNLVNNGVLALRGPSLSHRRVQFEPSRFWEGRLGGLGSLFDTLSCHFGSPWDALGTTLGSVWSRLATIWGAIRTLLGSRNALFLRTGCFGSFLHLFCSFF